MPRPFQAIRLLPWIIVMAAGGLHAQVLRQRPPHVHGITTIDIAVAQHRLQMTLEAPGANMVGFEHPPSDSAQQKQLASVLAVLNAPAAWLQPATAAGCKLNDVSVQPHGFVDTQREDGHEHADIDARYDYDCAAPEALDHIDIHLAERYPATHQIVVNLALPQREDRQVLDQGQYRVVVQAP